MTDEESPRLDLVPLPYRTLGPARSLALRTLATLQASDLAVPRRLVVAADGSAMFITIGAALEVAGDGDEIVVEPGRYVEHLNDRTVGPHQRRRSARADRPQASDPRRAVRPDR